MVNSIVSRIELRHVMNTYTNYQPNAMPNNMNNNGGFFDPMSDTNNPDYDFIQHFSMGHFMPTTMNNRPFLPPRPMMPFQSNVNSDPMTTNHPPPVYVPTTTTTPRPMPAAIDNNSDMTNDICGTRYSSGEVTPLVFGGEETKRGKNLQLDLWNHRKRYKLSIPIFFSPLFCRQVIGRGWLVQFKIGTRSLRASGNVFLFFLLAFYIPICRWPST